MAPSGSNASLPAAAATYAISCVSNVTPDVLSWPTPCAGWDVAMLLRHLNDSLTVVHEGIAAGQVGLGPADPSAGDQGMDLVAKFCDLRAPRSLRHRRPPALAVTIACRRLPARVLMSVAAVEAAVHGWTSPVHASASGRSRPPLPPRSFRSSRRALA